MTEKDPLPTDNNIGNYFENKVVAITGAATGIGRELSIQMANAGASLAISTGHNMHALETVSEEIKQLGAKVSIHQVDVADEQQLYNYATEVVSQYQRVDILVNNAGVYHVGTFENVSKEDFLKVMAINFWGVFHGMKAFIPYLKNSSESNLVNISSQNGLAGFYGNSVYCASKFAVRGLSEAVTQELIGSKISVSVVYLAPINTGIFDHAITNDPHLNSDTIASNLRKEDEVFQISLTDAVRDIMIGIALKKRRIIIGGMSQSIDELVRNSPDDYHELIAPSFKKVLFGD